MNRRELSDYFVIRSSGLFDRAYYLREYRDVRLADIDPLWHFVKFGWKEGRNPSKEFDTRYYLEQNPDVKNAGVNPVVHYIQFGINEGRAPNPIHLESQHNTSPQIQNGTEEKSPSSNYVNNYVWLDEEALEIIADIYHVEI